MGINWSNMWSLPEEPTLLQGRSLPERQTIGTDGLSALSDERLLMQRAARAIVRRRLSAPALLFLESMRPLSFIGSQALLVLRPLLSLAVEPNEFQALFHTLEDRRNFEEFLRLIEEAETANLPQKD